MVITRCSSKGDIQLLPSPLRLENQAASKDSPEAKGLLLKVKSVAFLLTSAFLVDVLECVNKLNLVFQRDNIDISSVTDMVESTVERLNFFKQEDGTTLTDVYNEINKVTGGKGGALTASHLNKLSYLKAAVKEGFR